MVKKVLIGVAALIVVFLVVVMLQPSKYHVERSAEINAPADVVWAEVSNFEQWKGWSHWEKSDPSQKTTITGEPGTVGHKTIWDGEKTGQGTMTITKAEAPNQLGIRLQFKTPMESEAATVFDIAGKGSNVEITWSLDGENRFMGKLFGLLMGMEDMIGSAYEDSLANLKTLVEENAKKQAK